MSVKIQKKLKVCEPLIQEYEKAIFCICHYLDIGGEYVIEI